VKPTIALFLHQPKCSIQSGNGIIKALQSDYNFKIFTRHELETDFFNDVDILAFPGGIGDAESYKWLFKENGNQVRNFVNSGGRYLGICMGAYWAGSHYFDLLKGVEAVQYITRPGTDTRRPHAKAIPIRWQGKDMRMYFYDGCALVGNGSYKTIATYANGDAMSIIQNRIGLIGCHPESSESWYNQYNYLKPYWHHGAHQKLLLDFVNLLMKQ
jgi:Biotin-protein ligase, N terminal